MNKKLCRYVLEMRRSSNIEGVFILSDETLNALKEACPYNVRYGEIAGKHSDVTCDLEYKDIEIVSDKPEEIEFFERLFPHGVGLNFPGYWFNDDQAMDCGWEAGEIAKKYGSYKGGAEEALQEYKSFDNSIMREAFIQSFNDALNDKY